MDSTKLAEPNYLSMLAVFWLVDGSDFGPTVFVMHRNTPIKLQAN